MAMNRHRASSRGRLKRTVIHLMIHAILLVGATYMIFPFVWMILTSLKSFNEATSGTILPERWLFSNYQQAIVAMNGGRPCILDTPEDVLKLLNTCRIVRYFANTIFVGFITVAGILTTGTLAAYAFARLRFPGRDALFVLLLATLMIPFEVILVPNFVLIVNLGWNNTYWALTIPFAASAFSVFLLRQFFRSIPNDLYDAAVLDGASHLRFLVTIVVPLSRPALLTSGLLTFLGTWNALMWPLLVTSSPLMRPIQVGLSTFIQEGGTQVQLLLSAATITIIPMLITYLVLQRHFVEGIASVGIRG
jgi:multiple sugar transport system permease protein